MRQREVFMRVSTRSFSRALLLVLVANLFVAASDARGQSQFVTVRFQGQVTSVFQSGGNLPVAVGDGITGFFVYDLTKPAQTVTSNSAVYPAAVCSGFTTGGITVTTKTTATTDRNYVNIRDNANFIGVPSDQFTMGLSQNKTIFLPPNAFVQDDVMDFAVYTNSLDPYVNPTTLTSDLMQVMPAVGWNHLYFGWSETSGVEGNPGPSLAITADHGQPFQISVAVGAPAGCTRVAAASRDFDGDQMADLVVFRPDYGNWYVRTSSLNYSVPDARVYQWGSPGDIPMSGDFDGDGKADLTVWRPSNGTWYLRYSSLGYSSTIAGQYQWGQQGDVPLIGDFDGDGKTDLTVWRPSTGMWYVRYSSLGYDPSTVGAFQWGTSGDIPVTGDFDGDGKTDLAVFRPSIGGWFIRFSSSGYSVNTAAYFQWGSPSDQPLALDINGDGTDDLVVFRPQTGEWFVPFTSLGFNAANYGWAQWGQPGDLIPR
jgi:VCBS repeat protein